MSNLSVIRCTLEQFSDIVAEPGQVVYIKDSADDPGRLVMWTGTEWQAIEANSGGQVTMTAYEMNQQLIHQLPDLDRETIAEKKRMINKFCNETKNKFYMLLCRDTNYYTLFHRTGWPDGEHIVDLVTECAETQGAIKSIELIEGAIEIWVDNPYFEDGTHVMYFFPYDGGVETCR